MPHLRSLNIALTPIADIRILAKLDNLEELILDGSDVTNLSPLANHQKLNLLSVKDTDITNRSPLLTLDNLKILMVNDSETSNFGGALISTDEINEWVNTAPLSQ